MDPITKWLIGKAVKTIVEDICSADDSKDRSYDDDNKCSRCDGSKRLYNSYIGEYYD